MKIYYHEDEFVELQAALLTQDGKLVLSLARQDAVSGDSGATTSILEAGLIKAYCNTSGVRVFDLTKEKVVTGVHSAAGVPTASRDRLGESVKFIQVAGLPNKMAWKVGQDLWLNTANPSIMRAYKALGDQSPAERIELIVLMKELLSLDLDSAFRTLLKLIDPTGAEGAVENSVSTVLLDAVRATGETFRLRSAWESDARVLLAKGDRVVASEILTRNGGYDVAKANDILDSLEADWRRARGDLYRGNKIMAIKQVRNLTALGLKESKDLVFSWEANVLAAKALVRDGRRAPAVKMIRKLTLLSVQEAKALVETWENLATR